MKKTLRKSPRFDVFHALLFAALAVSTAAPAMAAVPLSTLLESTAGRVLFSEISAGRSVALQLVGTEGATGEALKTALSDPRMTAAAAELWTRLRHIEVRFGNRYPSSGNLIFGESAASSALSLEQRAYLEQLAREELDWNFVRTLPRVPSAPLRASDEAAQRIVESAAARLQAIPESGEERLKRWAGELKNAADQSKELAKVTRGGAVKSFDAYKSLRRAKPGVDAFLQPEFVAEILSDSGSKLLAERAGEIFAAVKADESAEPVTTQIVRALEAALKGEVPADTIASRIDALRTTGSVKALRRALGELTLDESRRMFYGTKPLQPTQSSWLGQYLAKTGAASVIRRFPVAPGSTEMGPQRLVVAVDANTLGEFKQLIANREIFFGQLHTPNQGTLMVEHAGKTGTYASLDGGAMRMPTQGTLLPLAVLSTSEGGRMTRYFDLGTVARGGGLSGTGGYDWSLTDAAMKPWKLESYCARSAYGSCTHWIANIPMGDALVTEYKFPGWVDFDPYTPAADRGVQSPEPRVATLEPYSVSATASGMGRELMHDVWSVPGHQQLADVLGVTDQSLAAELTNPGWVAITMTARVPQNRLPVVFVFVGDAKAPIDPNFNTQINAH